MHTCEPSGGGIFLPILRAPSVNFQNQYFWKFRLWNSCAEEKRREIRMVKVNVIFNDIRLLICLTPLQVNWFMLIN